VISDSLSSPQDYLIIVLIVVLLISMTLCCICMMCKKRDENIRTNGNDDRPAIHQVPIFDPGCDPDTGKNPDDLVRPGTPPPDYGQVVPPTYNQVVPPRKTSSLNSCPGDLGSSRDLNGDLGSSRYQNSGNYQYQMGQNIAQSNRQDY
jgi:hypothetical protein